MKSRRNWHDLGELLKQGQERLKKAGIQEYELDAWYLFEQAFSMSRARYFLDAKEEAAPEAPALKAYEDGLERRSGRVPSSISWAHRNSWAWSFLSMLMC